MPLIQLIQQQLIAAQSVEDRGLATAAHVAAGANGADTAEPQP